MNRTMVKRGVGAAALAIIAALLLGYLLKGKDQERQDVVDMNLPGAQEVKQSLNIPALKGDGSQTGEGGDATQQNADGTAGSDETVVASAEPAGTNQAAQDNLQNTAGQNTNQNNQNELDFTIRPPRGEQRRVIDKSKPDNNGSGNQSQQQAQNQQNDAAQQTAAGGDVAASADGTNNSGSISRPSEGSVVASSEPTQQAYRPRLEGESARKPSYGIIAEERPAKPSKPKAQAPVKQSKPAAKPAASSGRYAIQLLATSSSTRANSLKNQMRKEGYNTTVSKTTKSGKVLFRVRIVGYGSRSAAAAAQNKMKRRYTRNQAVNNSYVVAN